MGGCTASCCAASRVRRAAAAATRRAVASSLCTTLLALLVALVAGGQLHEAPVEGDAAQKVVDCRRGPEERGAWPAARERATHSAGAAASAGAGSSAQGAPPQLHLQQQPPMCSLAGQAAAGLPTRAPATRSSTPWMVARLVRVTRCGAKRYTRPPASPE